VGRGWYWASGIAVVMLGATVWFFGLRRSELAVQTPRALYVLPVPRTFFLRRREVLESGGGEVAMLVAAPPGPWPSSFGLKVERRSGGPLTETELSDEIHRYALGAHGRREEVRTVRLDGRVGVESQLVRTIDGVAVRGRIQLFQVEDELVWVLLTCSGPGCEDEPWRVNVLAELERRP
jgi:hypothetical protein